MITPSQSLLFLDPKTIYQPDRQRQDLGDISKLADSIAQLGQLQPILVHLEEDGRYRLVAGGRRCAACAQIGCNVMAVLDSDIKPEELDLLELEENVRRKSLTWQEEVVALERIHTVCVAKAERKAEKWLPLLTGEMMGVSKSSVYNALLVAKHLRLNDKEVASAEGIVDALKVLARRAARKAEATIIQTARPEGSSVSAPATVAEVAFDATLARPKRKLDIVHGKACEWLLTQADGSLSCIYTDPPYAIEMGNIQQSGGGMGVEDVKATHDVTSNTTELAAFIDLAAQKLRPGAGFLALWCDFWNFRWLADCCEAAGLAVQRWPLVWNKTSMCQNMAASYNWTKSAEACLVARTPKTMLISAQSKSVYTCGNDKPDWITNPFFKPLDLHKWVLSGIAVPGSTVVDPYGGCGSIPLACVDSHYDAIMVEMDETHIAALQQHLA